MLSLLFPNLVLTLYCYAQESWYMCVRCIFNSGSHIYRNNISVKCFHVVLIFPSISVINKRLAFGKQWKFRTCPKTDCNPSAILK